MSRQHAFEDSWHRQLANADEALALKRQRDEERRRHQLVMAHMRRVTMDVSDVPHATPLRRLVRWLCSPL